MKCKGSGLTITELHRRYFSWKLSKFWEIVWEVFSKINLKKQNQWCNVKVLITISGYIFIYLTFEKQVRSLLKSLSVKYQIFTLNKTYSCFGQLRLLAFYRYKTKAKKLYLKNCSGDEVDILSWQNWENCSIYFFEDSWRLW